MHLPEKEEGAHGKTRSALERHSVPATYSSGATFATVELQVARLIMRFPVSPPVARVVAEHCFGRPA